jgi:hypothetical protein
MRVVISLPVHENAEVVLDQINNIRFFVPESIIVLHISKEFTGWGNYTVADFEKMDGVLVNPMRYSTSYATGILLYLHMSNFEVASSYCDFDFFNLHSSNELFIKFGLIDYLKNFEGGFFRLKINPDTNWSNGKAAFKDLTLKKIMTYLQISDIYGSQIEGTFYNKPSFNAILKILKKYITPEIRFNMFFRHDTNRGGMRYFNSTLRKTFFQGELYAKEEIYFPTIAVKYAKKIGTPYAYLNWKNNLVVTCEEIDDIITDAKSFIKNLNILSNDENRKYEDLFSVKRIQRRMDDPIRQYIHNLMKK